ncbi:MAG: hypothetical protein V2I33_08465 [Kangiellaceae bacterium]|jgi:hypothetical protein|nr:hypothetical protein [Kangiellaceae bacterium]
MSERLDEKYLTFHQKQSASVFYVDDGSRGRMFQLVDREQVGSKLNRLFEVIGVMLLVVSLYIESRFYR